MTSAPFRMTAEAWMRYLKRRNEDLLICQKAIRDAQWDALQNIGHRLKGSAPSFGFIELGDLGARLESAAENQKIEQCASLVRELSEWISKQSGDLPQV